MRPRKDTDGSPRERTHISEWPDTNVQNTETASINNIRAVRRCEFIQDLCWDVEKNEGPSDSENDIRVISPRVQAVICSRLMNILLDTGSEVTCMSDAKYNQLKTENYLPE